MEIISGYVEVHVFRKSANGIEFLMLKRGEKEAIYPGLWQMVTGKILPGEKAFEAALRELKEETKLSPIRFWVAPKVNEFYSAEKDAIYLVPVFAAETDNSSTVSLSIEHCEYKWINPDEAANLLPWDEQRRALQIITAYILNLPDYLDLVEIKINS